MERAPIRIAGTPEKAQKYPGRSPEGEQQQDLIEDPAWYEARGLRSEHLVQGKHEGQPEDERDVDRGTGQAAEEMLQRAGAPRFVIDDAQPARAAAGERSPSIPRALPKNVSAATATNW